MKNQRLRKISLVVGAALTLGFARSSFAQSADEPAAAPVKQRFFGKVADTVSDSTSNLINNAMQLIGVRYRWGEANQQTGYDASAFVKYVFNDTLGFLFPTKSGDMSQVGFQVSRDKLKPGDLVFFNTLQRANSHVGIYVGEDKFIHAPARGASVRVDDMTSKYWEQRFDGARRVEALQNMNEASRQQFLQEAGRL